MDDPYPIMITTQIFLPKSQPSEAEESGIAQFLFTHLEQFGDPVADIKKCMDYALQKNGDTPGGFIVVANDEDKITGAVIVNRTGMKDYIPENILVYIATHGDYRGQGIGKMLMNAAIHEAEGDIALHVEADNPAKKLYEKLGFTNKYLEMRLKK